MYIKISPIIKAKELLDLSNLNNVVITYVGNKNDFEENFRNKHLDKAVFVDLDEDLAAVPDNFANGGRHPLPSTEKFAETLKKLGISNDSHIIIYDDQNGAAAARFWWMLRSIGHKKVQVLNGGIEAAKRAGYPITDKIEQPKTAITYHFDQWNLPMANLEEVEDSVLQDDHLVIDVRANERYRGEEEPIDSVAGHIPGALNIPFAENLDKNGHFLLPDKLKKKYQTIFKGKNAENIIIHCGSGVTACHTLLAIDYAGLDLPKLYVGSWSEWSRNNKEIATDTDNS